VGLVFLRDRKSLTSLGGARSRSNAAGGIERMDCSNKRVRSKLERPPWMIGPKRLSFAGSQVAAISYADTSDVETQSEKTDRRWKISRNRGQERSDGALVACNEQPRGYRKAASQDGQHRYG